MATLTFLAAEQGFEPRPKAPKASFWIRKPWLPANSARQAASATRVTSPVVASSWGNHGTISGSPAGSFCVIRATGVDGFSVNPTLNEFGFVATGCAEMPRQLPTSRVSANSGSTDQLLVSTMVIRRAERAGGVPAVMASRQDCAMLAGGPLGYAGGPLP